MNDTSQQSSYLWSLTKSWMDDGVAPADVVDILVQIANRITDQNNLEFVFMKSVRE